MLGAARGNESLPGKQGQGNVNGARDQTGAKARILLVDDHPLVLTGLAQVINSQADLTVCAEASTPAATLSAVAEHQPDLVVLDLRLKEGDGLELIKILKGQFPDLRILVLSQFDEAVYAERVLRAGAQGYLMKDQATGELLNAIRTVLDGEVYLNRTMASRLLQKRFTGQTRPRAGRVEKLSDRELEVLMLLGAGMSTRRIARQLGLSVKTIETYREHLKDKLNLPDATELVHFATNWVEHFAHPGQRPD